MEKKIEKLKDKIDKIWRERERLDRKERGPQNTEKDLRMRKKDNEKIEEKR